jgi:hypothetical protein
MKESMVCESANPYLFKKTLRKKCFFYFVESLMKKLQMCVKWHAESRNSYLNLLPFIDFSVCL